ncbi:molybdopterin-dependent oxidoreductase [Hymenobacter sp. BT491]|uniref:molybdopterin-dependent oxidoreductase n=1 Tax=Hymenobacter sp. BT491 TaxID=2766779 RepID=UPI001653598F|nr:molybdopterin-dependent oxidoreductase [Hymenobacter sp. BT491]MBC6988413.1 molybdopterin-dependent oxidoreductase [Hymenobacter sp. BT491]
MAYPESSQPAASGPALPESQPTTPVSDEAVERQAARRTRRAFLVGGVAALAGIVGWNWLLDAPQEDGLAGPLRRVLDANGRLATAYFRNTRLATEFPKSHAKPLRKNGTEGLKSALGAVAWRLQVQGYAPAGTTPRMQEFTLDEVKALPRVEMTTEFKCIEGWSTIVTWAGTRLSDFLAKYPLATSSGRPVDPNNPPTDLAPYVSLVTPDKEYYVGLEIESALHPQTLLCYEMNGAPLTPEHGAPLRLVTPLKYGIKHIKRIGTIAFLDQRPPDYWAVRGYDWHAGH